MKKSAANVLLDTLIDLELDTPCNEMLAMARDDWCYNHCKAGQDDPTRKCWKKYAKLKAKENKQ